MKGNRKYDPSDVRKEHLSIDVMQAYINGTLLEADASAVQEHLQKCELCREAMEGLSVMERPENLTRATEEVNARILARTAASRDYILWRKIAVAAIVVLLVGVSVFGYFNFAGTRTEKIYADNFQKYPDKFNWDSVGKASEKPAPISPPVPALSEEKKIERQEGLRSPDLEAMADMEITLKDETMETDDITEESATAFSGAQSTEPSYNIKQDGSATKKDGVMSSDAPPPVPASKSSAEVVEELSQVRMGNAVGREAVQVDEILRQAMNYYNLDDHTKAIALFDLLLQEQPGHPEALLYGGVSLLESGNTGKAMIYFERLKKQKNISYYEEADWYMALALIRSGKDKKASQLLQEIIDNKGKYRSQAERALKDLN